MKDKFCEIFRTGKHTDSSGHTREWTLEDLEKIKNNFESVNPDVPVCVGHPKTNSPAYGWIDKLKIAREKGVNEVSSSDGKTTPPVIKLYAAFKDVQPEFEEAVKKGLFRTRSISLTKDLVLRHLAFLGAQAPAIKGMEQFCFESSQESESEDSLIISFSDDIETPDQLKEGEQMEEELKKQIAVKDEELAAVKKELEEARQEALKKEFEEFCDSAVADGNILPAQRENVLNLLFANADTNINFDDGSSKTSNEVFKDFVKSLRQMDYGKVAKEGNAAEIETKDFSDFKAEDWETAIKEEIAKSAQIGVELNPAQALTKLKG